jgi:hypothetical protein
MIKNGKEELNVDTPYTRSVHRLQNKLQNKLQSRYESTAMPESKTLSENIDVSSSTIEEGYLFMTCIRCLSMIAIKFGNKTLPAILGPVPSLYENGIIMTMCSQCEIKTQDKFVAPNIGSSSDDYAYGFKNLMLSPDLMKNSDVMKIAKLIVREEVSLMKCKDHMLYMNRKEIMKMVKNTDKIMGVNKLTTDDQNPSQLLLPYLTGGFI